MTEPPPLTAAEVGSVEMFNVQQACVRFKTPFAGEWHAERYGQMAAAKLRSVLRDIHNGRQSSVTEHRSADAYNLARMAFDGWRGLRGDRNAE